MERRSIPPSGVHVVQPGETLSEIAYIYRLNALALARANSIDDINRISPGQELALLWNQQATISHVSPRSADARQGDDGNDPGPQDQRTPLRVIITPPAAAADPDTAPPEAAPPEEAGAATTARAAAPDGLPTPADVFPDPAAPTPEAPGAVPDEPAEPGTGQQNPPMTYSDDPISSVF